MSGLPGCILLGTQDGLFGVALVVEVADESLEERYQTSAGHRPVLVVTCRYTVERQYNVIITLLSGSEVSALTYKSTSA